MLDLHARVVLDTLLPSRSHARLTSGLFDAGFDLFYQDFARTANRTMRLTFRVALFTATWLSPLLIRRMPPLSRHPRDVREQALAAMESSRFYLVRQLLLILKTVASLCYGANRDVRDAIGYPPPLVSAGPAPQEAGRDI